jgi:hypothetical protein
VTGRRMRGATESLLSIVLGLEAALMFFVTLTIFGLNILPDAVALAGGALTIVLFVVAAAVVGRLWGLWLGWVLQAGLIALGLILPALYVAALIFIAIWIYCFVKGRQLDRARGAFESS